jgi:carbon-monoxide dehydrogenase medium subunit
MKAFAYARPTTEPEALALLSPKRGRTEVLAGGTDLLSLMHDRISTPDLVVDIKGIAGMGSLQRHPEGLVIGALATLDDLLESDLLDEYPSLTQAALGVAAMQIRSRRRALPAPALLVLPQGLRPARARRRPLAAG